MGKYPPVKDQILYLFSSSELIISYFTLFYTFYKFNLYAGILTLLLIFKIGLLFLVKKIFGKFSIGKRPEKAFNCDMFSCGGQSVTPGFPSGHMLLLGMLSFVVYNVYDRKPTRHIPLLYFLVVFTTMIGRVFTKCHTITQALGALIMGAVLGFILYFIDHYIKDNVEIYDKHREEFYNSLTSSFSQG